MGSFLKKNKQNKTKKKNQIENQVMSAEVKGETSETSERQEKTQKIRKT